MYFGECVQIFSQFLEIWGKKNLISSYAKSWQVSLQLAHNPITHNGEVTDCSGKVKCPQTAPLLTKNDVFVLYLWQPLPPSPPPSSPLLADSATLEISRTMVRVKAWITVVSYLSPHLQPVVSLSEDVVKPSQTLKHPVASPCLYSPQPPTHTSTHTHTSPLWQFTLGWGLATVDGSRGPEMLPTDVRRSDLKCAGSIQTSS